jgi:hypothetical protein
MGASASNSSQETTNSKEFGNAPGIGLKWEPGPDLKQPGRLKRRFSILHYALQSRLIQIAVMVIALVLLIDLVLKWDVLRPPIHQDIFRILFSQIISQNAATLPTESPSNWVDWWIRVQSILGFGTLLVATFVWHGEICEDWENALPKRMSVFFLHEGRPVIISRYIWLADEGDLRAWGQQVAAQAACERFLNFYPNVKAQNPGLAIWIDGNICRHYAVCFELTDENPFLARYSGMCRYQNMATGSNTVSSVPLADLQKRVSASVFPFDWPEKPVI